MDNLEEIRARKLAELQASVRKLARERVAPRAREIDTTESYPQDLFDLFVETGLTGLCIPEELGGGGAGILGLTIAIEEVARYSQAAALMLLLTRLPTGPVLIAGTEDQQRRYVAPIASGEARAAFGLSEPQAGSDVMGIRTRAVPEENAGGSVLKVRDLGKCLSPYDEDFLRVPAAYYPLPRLKRV